VFIDRVLAPLVKHFPALRVVFEHVTTQQAVQFVQSQPHHLAATITAHHLLLDRNALFQGGLRPHHYCLPVLKRAVHRDALITVATSGDTRFFLGTDSAPHPVHAKESACGCAGIYTAHAALELYAEVFEQAGALQRLERFASENGAAFYRLPLNPDRVRLRRESWTVPASLPLARTSLVPFRAGDTCAWKLIGEHLE
jgi:dihydroorotase